MDADASSLATDEQDAQPEAPGLSAASARSRLDEWLAAPQSKLTLDALGWAALAEDWDALTQIWFTRARLVGLDDEPGLAEVMARLPREAREASPLLSLPWAVARAETTAPDPSTREALAIKLLLSDAVTLHSNWQAASSTDAALAAATFWMLAQRMMPGTPQVGGLDQAWATQAEIVAYTGEQRRAGRPPRNLTAAIFRAAAAQIALARAEFDQALAESLYALALDPRGAKHLVGGTRKLALVLAGSPGDGEPEPPRGVRWEHDEPSWFHTGLAAQDALSGTLADGLEALRRLDRDACRSTLDSVGPLPRGSAQWTTVAFLRGLHAALWEDAAAGLSELDAAIAWHGTASVEQHEPLGDALLRRARVALLDRLGAGEAALAGSAGLPDSWLWVARARSLMWAQDFAAAAQAADEGIFEPTTPMPDRYSLQAVRAASAALMLPPEMAAAGVVRAVGDCLARSDYLPIGMLPAGARDALLALYASEGATVGAPPLPAAVIASLDSVVRRGGPARPAVALTQRERALLPLLGAGGTLAEIAAELQVSPSTVRTQVAVLRAKFDAESRSELVRKARDAGLV